MLLLTIDCFSFHCIIYLSPSWFDETKAVIFQTLFGSAKKDLSVEGKRIVNLATGTRPCVVHANGWDKGPLLTLLIDTGRLTDEYQQQLVAKKVRERKREENNPFFLCQ